MRNATDAGEILGHIVGEDGVFTDPEKVQAVKDWELPVQLKELQAFLGTVDYYRQYIANFTTIAHPLSRLTSKGVDWNWAQEEQEAFELLGAKLVSAPILGYPEADEEYILDTDASAHEIGGVLS